MATTIQEVTELLDNLGIKYEKHDDFQNALTVVYSTETYVYQSNTGEKSGS